MRRIVPIFDRFIIARLHRLEAPLARTAIFVVYFWFGLLKLAGVSPAGPLVQALAARTIPGVPFDTFYALFAAFEMAIGAIFLIRGWERAAIFLLGLHLVTTAMPLLFLPAVTWQAPLVPTLEGQYIIKNILIVAVAVVIGSKLVPMQTDGGA
jgi:uncharacterized membrane protein YkgB